MNMVFHALFLGIKGEMATENIANNDHWPTEACALLAYIIFINTKNTGIPGRFEALALFPKIPVKKNGSYAEPCGTNGQGFSSVFK